MTLQIIIILYVLIIHWIADFGLQTSKQAENKSHNFLTLVNHVTEYTLVLSLSSIIFMKNLEVFGEFFAINFIAHLVTDFITSKINAHLWKKGDIHNFFVSVGFDQLIHQLTLVLTVVYILTPGV